MTRFLAILVISLLGCKSKPDPLAAEVLALQLRVAAQQQTLDRYGTWIDEFERDLGHQEALLQALSRAESNIHDVTFEDTVAPVVCWPIGFDANDRVLRRCSNGTVRK